MTSSPETALTRLSAANPVPERLVAALVPNACGEQLLQRIVSSPVPVAARPRRLPRRARRIVLAAALVALLAGPAYAVARSLIDGWLTGEPAPPSAVANFKSYTPELGFQPDSSRAVVVAQDGDVRLYATTNDRGSYCLAADAPDGGTCLAPAFASAPFVAGIMADDPSDAAAGARLLVAGRTDNLDADTIRFTDPVGRPIVRSIGSSGFFIAAVPMHGSPCTNGDWKPRFNVLDVNGEPLASATITLARAVGVGGVCSWFPPHP